MGFGGARCRHWGQKYRTYETALLDLTCSVLDFGTRLGEISEVAGWFARSNGNCGGSDL